MRWQIPAPGRRAAASRGEGGRSLRISWCLVFCLGGVAAPGCGDDPTLAPASGEVRVRPEGEVAFPRTYVGYPTTATVTVENDGRAPVDLGARVDGPFGLEAAPGSIPGSGAVDLVLSFAPSAPGPAAGTLVIEAGGTRFERAVTATAVAPPVCSTALPCRISSFDPEAGSCLHEPAPDGASCTNHCVADGQCLDGECRGANDGCDDGDPCTRDLIADDCSCRHEPLPDRETHDPCRTETCVPGVGWQETRAPDGTACGPVNECVGYFCTAGVCAAGGEALEGTICREGTTCRRPSRCVRNSGGTMECRPAGDEFELSPVWRVTPVGNREIRFEAVTDHLYLYWAECDHAGCGLRSISPLVHRPEICTGRIDEDGDGLVDCDDPDCAFDPACGRRSGGDPVRAVDPDPLDFDYEAFDRWGGPVPMFEGEVHREGGLVLSRGLLFSTLRPGWLEAYDAVLGEAVFRLDLGAEGMPAGRGATAVNAHGDVVLLVAAPGDPGPRTVLAVSPAGTVAWRVRREGDLAGLLADENGHVYFGEEREGESFLVSLDGKGDERFAVEAAPGGPLAAYDDRILHGDGSLFATSDGAALDQPLPILVPGLALPPLLTRDVGWLAGYPVGPRGPDWDDFSLFPFDPDTGEAGAPFGLGTDATPWSRSEPLLVRGAAGTRVLVAHGLGIDSCGAGAVLLEATETGVETSCALAPGSYGGPATVLSSLWITRDACRGTVAAFLLEVAGQGPRSLANGGWIGGGGEPGRGRRPLP